MLKGISFRYKYPALLVFFPDNFYFSIVHGWVMVFGLRIYVAPEFVVYHYDWFKTLLFVIVIKILLLFNILIDPKQNLICSSQDS